MDTPQYLYHGTSEIAARRALVEGLHPRKTHRKSNWKRTIESNPDTVYLTDAYPVYFALNATRNGKGAVLQIDASKLDQLYLVPDEDVLEQAGRGHDDVPGNMRQRTRHWRSRMVDYLATDKWLVSLDAMGTCGSMKPIPPAAITRVALIDFNQCRHLSIFAGDAMICLANYRLCGPKYRGLTQRLFGLDVETDPLGIGELPPITDDMDANSRAFLSSMAEHRKAANAKLDAELATVRFIDPTPGGCARPT